MALLQLVVPLGEGNEDEEEDEYLTLKQGGRLLVINAQHVTLSPIANVDLLQFGTMSCTPKVYLGSSGGGTWYSLKC